MSNRAWMPLHIDAYLGDTGHLSALEHGAYLLLIMHYWKHGCLPADERLIARHAKLTPEQWAESRDILAALFMDGWRHKRIDEELAKADEIIAKRRAAASARHKASKPDAHAMHMQSKSSDTGALPSTNNLSEKEEPIGSSKKRGTRLPDDFEPSMADAIEAGIDINQFNIERLKFLDYWRGLPGQRGVKLDWPATWRNWCRKAAADIKRAAPRANGPPRPGRMTPTDANQLLTEMHNGREAQRSHEIAGVIPADGGQLRRVDQLIRGAVNPAFDRGDQSGG